MQLYEFGSTRSIRVRWVLQELGLPFESIAVNLLAGEHRRPEFLNVNPAGKVPMFIDGPVALNESVAIVLYLAEKHPEHELIPRALAERAQFYRWLFFTTNELEQPIWRIARNTFVYPPKYRLPDDIPNAHRDFKAMARVLDAHMQGREYVVTDRVTVADFVLAYTLDWAGESQLLDDFPGLTAYVERMYRRPKAPARIAQMRTASAQ